jgi:hypothetical protein
LGPDREIDKPVYEDAFVVRESEGAKPGREGAQVVLVCIRGPDRRALVRLNQMLKRAPRLARASRLSARSSSTDG